MSTEKMNEYHKERKSRIDVHRKLFGKDDVKAVNNSISKHNSKGRALSKMSK